MTSPLDRIEQRLPAPTLIAGTWLAAGAMLGELRAAGTILTMAAPALLLAGEGWKHAAAVIAMGAIGAVLAGAVPS